MQEYAYTKWSPGGNTTLFLDENALSKKERRDILARALLSENLSCEQAGSVDCAQKSLRMAAEEFCLNATRAFGALLMLRDERKDPSSHLTAKTYLVQVSGWPTPISLHVNGSLPHYICTATLSLPQIPITELEEGMVLVELPGITHILLKDTTHPLPQKTSLQAAKEAFAHYSQKYHLPTSTCLGLIFWHEEEQPNTSQRNRFLVMHPLVSVPAVETLFWEQCCGSGALALALAQKNDLRDITLLQPSGATLDVHIEARKETLIASVCGSVELISQGSLWL